MKVSVLRQQDRYSVYVNDTRIAGSKPWGGGEVVASWDVKPMEILKAMGAKYSAGGENDDK